MAKSRSTVSAKHKTLKISTPPKNAQKQSFENKWGWHPKPLKASFMAFALLVFLVSAYLIYPLSLNWGISFMLIFTIMFISSVVSMTKAPVVKE